MMSKNSFQITRENKEKLVFFIYFFGKQKEVRWKKPTRLDFVCDGTVDGLLELNLEWKEFTGYEARYVFLLMLFERFIASCFCLN